MRRAIAVYRRGHWPEDTAAGSVTLAYLDRHRRRIRLVADSGETFLLDLARAYHLADGDGLELDSGGYLCVRAAPEPVFEIEAPDHAIADMVTGLGGRIVRLEAPFDPEFGAYAGTLPHHADE